MNGLGLTQMDPLNPLLGGNFLFTLNHFSHMQKYLEFFILCFWDFSKDIATQNSSSERFESFEYLGA